MKKIRKGRTKAKEIDTQQWGWQNRKVESWFFYDTIEIENDLVNLSRTKERR